MASQSSRWMMFLFLAVSLSTIQVSLSARALLQATGSVPAGGSQLGGFPTNLPPFPTMPNLPFVGNAGGLPTVNLPPLSGAGAGGSFPNLPVPSNIPTIPNLPTTLPRFPNLPTTLPTSLPFVSPPPSN